MKAIVLKKFGTPGASFELRETEIPRCRPHEVLIRVEAFGLNFADVLARKGLYPETPPLPCVIGYEVVGTVTETGSEADVSLMGKRVVALTRFGGYAEYAVADSRATGRIPSEIPAGEALALATQFTTAYVCARESLNLYPGDRVLVHAAAGGVGIGLCQMTLNAGCIVFGTAGSDEKTEFLKTLGVHHVINYRKQDYANEISSILGDERLNVAFNSLAGKSVRKDLKLLGPGGKLVIFGASSRTGKGRGIFSGLKLLWQTGFITPLALIMQSKSIIGINILKLGDYRPELIAKSMQAVIDEAAGGKLKPVVRKTWNISELNDAHQALEDRKTIGKTVVVWE